MIGARRHASGFTLVEMLVALALLAVLGALAWRGLETLLHTRARIASDTRETERVIRTLAQLRHDVAAHVPDALVGGRDTVAERLPAAIELALDDAGRPRIALLRPQPSGNGFVRVTYSLGAGTFDRTTAALATGGEPIRVALLDTVRSFDVRVLLPTGWTDVRGYLDAGLGSGRVAALEFRIARTGHDQYTMVAPL